MHLVVITNISPHYLGGSSWAAPGGGAGNDSYEGQIVIDVYSDSTFTNQSSSGTLQNSNNAHTSKTYVFVNLNNTSGGSRSSRISTMSTFTTESEIRDAQYVQIYIKLREDNAGDHVWVKGVTFIVQELRSS